jgi:hypothetical protein
VYIGTVTVWLIDNIIAQHLHSFADFNIVSQPALLPAEIWHAIITERICYSVK